MLAQNFDGARQLILDRLHRNAQGMTNFRVRHSLQSTQQEDFATSWRQFFSHHKSDVFVQQAVVRGGFGVIAR